MTDTLTILQALRKKLCECNKIMNTPAFHAPECPYIPFAEAELRKAEKEKEALQ